MGMAGDVYDNNQIKGAQDSMLDRIKKDPEYKDLLENIKMQQEQLTAQAGDRPGIAVTTPSKYEKRAGIAPPGYEGTRDVKTGLLLDQYKIDPYQGEALQKLKEQAFSDGTSPWAKMQLEHQALQESGARDATAAGGAQAMAQAQSNLMRTGGLSSGARTRMAMQAVKDMARQQQGVTRQGVEQRMGIGAEDLSRKQGMLSNFGNLETQAQGANMSQQTGDINRKALFDMERYKNQMQAWGAEKTADGQRAAANSGGKK